MTEDAVWKAGGSAFPAEWPADTGGKFTCPGMTLRDWLAGQVSVRGYTLDNPDVAARTLNIDPPHDDSADELLRFGFRVEAAIRYAIADAMLAERGEQ